MHKPKKLCIWKMYSLLSIKKNPKFQMILNPMIESKDMVVKSNASWIAGFCLVMKLLFLSIQTIHEFDHVVAIP